MLTLETLDREGYRQFTHPPVVITDLNKMLAPYGLTLTTAQLGEDLFYKVVPLNPTAPFTGAPLAGAIAKKLAEQPDLPCRVDEMTPREQVIFNQFTALYGFLTFLSENIEV